MITPDTRFWVVTYPTPLSVIEDICFETNLRGLQLQFAGGLDSLDICTIENNESTARQAACSLLGVEYRRAK